mgnify:CR=1 FL=1
MPVISDFLREENIMSCSCGDTKSSFKPEEKVIKFMGKNLANEKDNIAGKNIFSFGKCSKTGEECKLETELKGRSLEWVNGYKGVNFMGQVSVYKDSKLKCLFGGIIKREG